MPVKHPLPVIACSIWLAGPLLVLGLSLFLSVGEGRQVTWLPGLALPEICALHAHLGIDCPGCGLTRSFIHLADANPRAAWRLNPVGIFLFLYVIVQIPLAAVHLQVSLARRNTVPHLLVQWTKWNERWLAVLMFALLVQWIIRLATGELFR